MKILKLKYLAVTVLFLFALGISLERPAYAYVDPGSSLLFFQSASAVVTGTLFYFRRRLKTLIGRGSTTSTPASEK